MSRGTLVSLITLASLTGLLAYFLHAAPAAALPGGFEDRLVADVPAPTALDFTPDGRMLVASKPGQLYVVADGRKSEALNLGPQTCDNSERGLLGVAVDPRYGTAGHDFVYLYYTFNKHDACPEKQPESNKNPVNRVSRFAMEGNTIDKSTEDVLIDNIKSPNGNHNGGDLHFGKDGNLYVSVGDGACDYAQPTHCQYENDASRDKNVLNGKILRVTPAGDVPDDNPFTGPNSAPCNVAGDTDADKSCQETYLRGFRNPFRFAIDPDSKDTLLRIDDVGGQRWEEIDQAKVGAAGNDYGWNLCEGRHDNPYRAGEVDCTSQRHKGPIHEYNHNTGCESITGGAFVPDGFWPARYDDAYLFGDYVCGKVFSLTPKDGGGYHREVFQGGTGGTVAMAFGPYRDTGRALYYTSFKNGGVIHRIANTAGDQIPISNIDTVGENYGTSMTMNFDASGSRDPDGEASLAYLWDFGDGATQTTDVPASGHTYSQRGKYVVTLTVRDGSGEVSDPARIEVFPGDTPPEPVIESPAEGSPFHVDEQIVASGSATDAEGDPVIRRWDILQHHDGNHTHPWNASDPDIDVGSFAFNGPAPEGLYSTDPDLNYIEVRMTATDSLGLSKTVSLYLRPRVVAVTFVPRPSDLRLVVNGRAFRGLHTLTSWVGYDLNAKAPRQKDRDGHLWGFRSWSDGGAATHVIETTLDPKTYTASFRRLRR